MDIKEYKEKYVTPGIVEYTGPGPLPKVPDQDCETQAQHIRERVIDMLLRHGIGGAPKIFEYADKIVEYIETGKHQ
jgi:hypothetical protein